MFRAAFRRLLAIDDPPERTALAFSIGVFIAFSPFLGLHTIIATALAFLFRFNKIAIYTGTSSTTLLTLVPIIIASYTSAHSSLAALCASQTRAGAPDTPADLFRRLLQAAFCAELEQHCVAVFSRGMALSVVCSALAYPLTLRALRAYRARKKPKIHTE
jgi:uncharacterized protein (DUF2062 family)